MQIYPRDLLTDIKTGLSRKAFVMMPFSQDLESTYVTVMDACRELALDCTRADSLYDQKPILTNVVESIGSSQVLIADLTGKNPNVFYEVGIAHATRRLESVILVSQTLDDVPFDLRHLPILLYSPEEALKFKISLKQRIQVSLATTDGLNVIRHLMFGAEFGNQQVSGFIDLVSRKFPGYIQQIARFIDDSALENDQFEPVYWALVRSLDEVTDIEKKQIQFLAMSLLSSNYAIREQRRFIEDQLQPVLVSRYSADEMGYPPIVAQLCFTAIKNNFLKNESIDWLLGYLNNEKVGNIDILRSQIETWLVGDDDEDVEAALISNLASTLPHMREAAADILGMRRNAHALRRINDALEIESDPYAARSMMTALSRSGQRKFGDTIRRWIVSNSHLWDAGPKSPSLPRTAKHSLRQLGYDEVELDKLDSELSKLV